MDLNHPLLAATSDDLPSFPQSQSQLIRLDRSLYCQICKEFYHGPVSIACGHSFCSQCIRSSLDTMKKCPTCGETAGEGSIRRNRALEEVVDSWEEARAIIITLSQPPLRKRPAVSLAPEAKRVKRDNAGSSRSQSPIKQSEPIEVVSSGEAEVLDENDEGECPICSVKLPITAIPMHIERGCPQPKRTNGTGTQKADWKKVFGGVSTAKQKEIPLKRMTKPNYNLTTPAELKVILSSHSLPTTGDKLTLESRVQDWILLYNSNIDTSHPKSMAALRAKLSDIEASRKRDKDRGKDALGEQLGTKEGIARYAKERSGEFEKLRKDILARKSEGKGKGKESTPIEVD